MRFTYEGEGWSIIIDYQIMGVDGILDTTPDYNTHRETINFVVEIVEIIEQPVYVIIPAPSSSQIKEFKQSLQGGLPSYAQKVLETRYLVEIDEANFMPPLDPLLMVANENMKRDNSINRGY